MSKSLGLYFYEVQCVRGCVCVLIMPTCRTPLTPEIKEVLEVAYVSNIMAKSFRREGQPEKERIAKLTGLPLEKVKNRIIVITIFESLLDHRISI